MVKQFGNTWWGEAWLEALEDRALIDPNRLPRGRTYARKGLVVNPELEPGLLSAQVEGTDVYTTSLGVRRLSDDEWDVVLDRVTTQAKLAAALMAGEVPHELHDVLLPDSGDLIPDCSCPDWAEPCKHAAALCYVAADLFDRDPFALLLLRGRGRDQVLTEVRKRRAMALGVADADGQISHRPRGADPGINAADAYRRWRSPTTIPSVPVPSRARTLPRLAVAPPADSGIEEGELRELVGDAARRAAALLVGEGSSGLELPVGADVARRAINGNVEVIASATGLPATELSAAARAFQHGGPAGMAVARNRWDAPVERLQSGIDALTEWVERSATPDSESPRVVRRANIVSAGAIQLRLDKKGTWWRFDPDEDLGWVLSAPGVADSARGPAGGGAGGPAELL